MRQLHETEREDKAVKAWPCKHKRATVSNAIPEIAKEAEEEGPKFDQAERLQNQKMVRDGEARKMSGEERRLPAIIQRVEKKETKKKEKKADRKLSKGKHVKAGRKPSREERSMDVIMRQIAEMEREDKARINASQCPHQRVAATKGTFESIDASGGDSKDDVLREAPRLPIPTSTARGTPEARVLATRASSDQAHKRKREASLKSQQSKDRRGTEEEESTRENHTESTSQLRENRQTEACGIY